MEILDTSAGEGAVSVGWVKFLNIKDKYFKDLSLWEIKNGKYIIEDNGYSNLNNAINYWTSIIPPQSNYYIWASAKYTALEIIINAIFQRIFALNKRISEAETEQEKEQIQEEMKIINNDISILKTANKELTQVTEEITKFLEKVKREEEIVARDKRAAERAAGRTAKKLKS